MSDDTKRGPGRPPVGPQPVTMEVRVDAALRARVRLAAEREGVTVSEWVRACLERELGR